MLVKNFETDFDSKLLEIVYIK